MQAATENTFVKMTRALAVVAGLGALAALIASSGLGLVLSLFGVSTVAAVVSSSSAQTFETLAVETPVEETVTVASVTLRPVAQSL